MKITEKYSLCDLCSKTIEHLEDNKMAKFLYFANSKTLIESVRFEREIKYSEKNHVSHLFDVLKIAQEKYLCTKCRGNLYKKNPPTIFFLSFREPQPFDLFMSETMSETMPVNINTVELTGFRTNGEIEFAEAKNQKLAKVYFAPINFRIEEMVGRSKRSLQIET